MTLLHVVAQMGNVSFLEELLFCCPLSIEDLTIRQETALHIAVKNRKLGTLRVLFGFIHRVSKEEILDWKDEDGNTNLHIAVSTNSLKVNPNSQYFILFFYYLKGGFVRKFLFSQIKELDTHIIHKMLYLEIYLFVIILKIVKIYLTVRVS